MAWTHTARFLTTASKLAELPVSELPEIAFVGRSNAGKSTAINVLTQQKRLAFASKTPGRTQHINLFELGPKLARRRAVRRPARLRLRRGRAQRQAALAEGDGRLPRRPGAAWRRSSLLLDSRLGFTEIDRNLLDFVAPRLANGSVKLLVLLTKVDKLNRRDTDDRAWPRRRASSRRRRRTRPTSSLATLSALSRRGWPMWRSFSTSAYTGGQGASGRRRVDRCTAASVT